VKLLTKNTDYAVRALMALATSGDRFISAREISKKQDLPYQYLRRILRELIKNRIVLSREGGGGGFMLKMSPEKLYLVDIIKIFQGNIQLSECMFRNRICNKRSGCVLRKRINKIEKKVIAEFSGITIKTLLQDMGAGI